MDETFYQALLDNLYDGVYFVDLQRRITFWNKASEQITGFSSGEMQGNYCWNNTLRHVNDEGTPMCRSLCPLAVTMLDGQPREAEVYLHHKAGHRVPVRVRTVPVRDSDGQIIGAVEVFHVNTSHFDTVQRIRELERLALLDPVTRLANRRCIEMNLHSRLEEMRRYDWRFGVLFIDVDHFKHINDVYGHSVGDEVLRMLGRTFTMNARASDMVGRWGGEEFVAIVRNVDTVELRNVAERFRMLAAQSCLTVRSTPVQVTLSIGATLVQSEDTIETVLQRADHLMYHSKQAGRNQVTLDTERV